MGGFFPDTLYGILSCHKQGLKKLYLFSNHGIQAEIFMECIIVPIKLRF